MDRWLNYPLIRDCILLFHSLSTNNMLYLHNMQNNRTMLSELLGSNAFLQVNKHLAKTLGLYEAAILAELIYLDKYFNDKGQLNDGFFFRTYDQLTENICITRKAMLKPMAKLEEMNIIETSLYGIPAKKHYKINHNNILNLFDNLVCPDGLNTVDPKVNYIRKNNKEKQKERKINSANYKLCTSALLNFFLRKSFNPSEIHAIKLNHSKYDEKGIIKLCKDFWDYMDEYYDINPIRSYNDIKEHTKLQSGTIGLMFMFRNDFEKFENIVKSIC